MGSKFEKNNCISDSESDCEESQSISFASTKSKDHVLNSSDVDSLTMSSRSVIEDSLSSISKVRNSTSENKIEESTSEDSSVFEEISAFGNVIEDSVNSQFVCSSSNSVAEVFVLSSSSSSEGDRSDTEVESGCDSEAEIHIIEESPEKSTDIHDSGVILQRSLYHPNISRPALERQIADKSTAYQNMMKAIQGCNMKKLKDGGKLLQEKMLRCKEELDDLKDKLKNLAGEDYSSPVPVKNRLDSNSIFSTKDQAISNLGRKGIETHRVEAALTIDALVTIHESLTTCPSEGTFEEDPNGLKIELMPHQKHALAWLLWRERQIPSGGILADDMGLGKTLSIISLILRSKEYNERNNNGVGEEQDVQIITGSRTYRGNTLVVCPASLTGEWESQIKRHCKPNILSVVIHHGRSREYQAKRLAGYDVVITTYGLMAEENKCRSDGKKGILFRVRWERIVMDEAHVIRNHKTQKAIAACDLIGCCRWCLTGTPVQNRELDMYSLLKFIRCSPFDDRNVWKRWVDNKSANGVQRLKTVIKAILLRRTKEDLKRQGELKELPNKNVLPIYIELDEEELKVYHEVLIFSKTLLAEYLRQKELRSGSKSDNMESIRNQLKGVDDIKTTEIFVLLLRLRQICCLPGLIHAFLEKETCIESGIEPDNPVIEDLYSQLSRMSISKPKPVEMIVDNEAIKNVLLKSNPVFKMDRPSTKIQTLLSILKEILVTDDKIVIVSQWTNVLKKLEQHIKHLNVGIVTLDGAVPVKFRSKIIEEFNRRDSDVRVMLLSLNAGGVGLNLMGGNRLIIFEPHWNPQLESQACDRVYRVGQQKEVFIYKIICRDTIEERIELLQKRKLELASNILQEADRSCTSQARQLTLPDLVTLFDL